MHPLCSSLILRQEGESQTQVNHLTLEICIHIKGIELSALCCYTRKPVELMRKGVQIKLEATRQPNKMLCISSGSSNCTSSCLCLCLLGNWVALLSHCDSSAAHYSSCWQRKRQQHQPRFVCGHYNGTVPGVVHGETSLDPVRKIATPES